MALSPAVGRPYTPPLDHINWWEEDKHGNNKWKNTTVETIKFIHRENPAYVKTKDRGFGRLPLHRAIVGSAEASVIMEIYQLYPHAIRHKDKNGYLPIHWAAERDRKDLIPFLYENYRLGLLEEDRMTNTPMELALRFNKKGAYTLTERFLNSMIVDGGVEFQAYKQKNGLGEKNEAVGSEHGGGSDDPAQTVRETEILQLPPLNKVQMPKKERERRKRSLEKKLLKQYKVSRKARAIIEKYQVDNLYCNTLSKEFFQRSRWVHTTVNTVERLNREKPRHVYTENSLGLVPLNYAVANGAPIGVVKALYGMYIGAVKHRDNNREIALHDAARNNSPAEVITFLTDIYPEGLTVQNKQDHTPYDIAKKEKCKLALELLLRIEDNLKATDEAAWKMYAQRNKGQIESLYSKNASRWEYSSIKHIRELHKKNPHHIRTPDISDNRKWLPLGYAIRSDASKDVVKHLYDLHPDSIKYKGAYGSLPLHIAADYNRIRHIPYLAQKYPISLHEKDIEGKTPLKRAILHDNDVAAEILTKLELKYKKKLDEHKLKLSTEELKIRKRYSLIAHEIDDLSSTSDKWKKTTEETIKYLHKCHPEDVETSFVGGVLPFHLAIHNNATPKVLGRLYTYYPVCIKHRDNSGWLPLHYAADNNRIDIIPWLVELYPVALTAKDRGDRTPLDLAEISKHEEASALLKKLMSEEDDVQPQLSAGGYEYYDWAEAYDDDGNVYYYNCAGESTYEYPW